MVFSHNLSRNMPVIPRRRPRDPASFHTAFKGTGSRGLRRGMTLIALIFTFSSSHAQIWDAERFLQLASLESLRQFQAHESKQHYTLLDKNDYQHIVHDARGKVLEILTLLKSNQAMSADDQIALIISQLIDKPYLTINGMGEGDWQPGSYTYKSGAAHIKQYPVYRFDGFDCQTFVQVVMSLLHAHSSDEFDERLIKIAYGAAGNPNGNIVRYYNRNHFVDADFNRINNQHGFLEDITKDKRFEKISKSQTITITRNEWFKKQIANLEDNVKVLNDQDGLAMAARFQQYYQNLPFPNFKLETIKINYLPKEELIRLTWNGKLIANKVLLDQIPTPAILENVRDVNSWQAFGRKMKDIIGSELSISHMGILYRHTFKKGEIIHYQTKCARDSKEVGCHVTPQTCQQNACQELMIAHATNHFPKHYLWYKKTNGDYTCSPYPPSKGTAYTSCNRVVAQPFFDYLTDKQFGDYWTMMPSFLGVHVEKIT